MTSIRIGHGYDVHRLTEGRKLIIGGVNLPCPLGLLGHSDADVLTHAIMDALIGALALGDIGKHFPDCDAKYEDVSSLVLAQQVKRLLFDNGYEIVNIDSTVIAQIPRLSPYIEQMRKSLAETLGIDISRINIKATTEERLGFTGNCEGIAAHAVCIIDKF